MVQDYWSTPFSLKLHRDKFIKILKFFHLCDNDNYALRGQEVYSPVNKLDTMYSVVTGNFPDVWKPGKNICTEEG